MAGYSGTPLVKKLGIKRGFSVAAINAPQDYRDLLGELPEGALVHDGLDAPIDLAHLFVNTRADLEMRIGPLKDLVGPRGVIWVSWPKRSSGRSSELTENVVREVAIRSGLVDVKVCAVDETWSGLKLVTRLKDRY